MRILNLYAGIGGNRKLWNGHKVTAIEINPQIAKIYQDNFLEDKVIITDAHKYLEENYKEFDFIWSSPPCPSHSKIRKYCAYKKRGNKDIELQNKPIYPDMKLYEEILFLQGYFKGKWVVENVNGWYKPLVTPQKIGRHLFWANFVIKKIKISTTRKHEKIVPRKRNQTIYGLNVVKYNLKKEWIVLRNMVNPELGLHILNCAFKEKQQTLN